MKAFNYYAPTEIIFGCGRVQEIGSITAQYGKKALLVTVPEFPEVKELYEKVKKSLRENGVEVVHFDGVIPNPTTDVVTEGANMAKAAGVDVVIGLGGGSSIDTAKAIAVEATHPGTAWDYNCHTPGPTSATLPIIAIGTTAGTGSQCTQCAVITKTSEKDKSAIWHKNIFPKVAIVDPEVTVTMPKSVTAQTGFDAFAHNFEAYLSVKTSPLVEMMAIEAIKMIKEYLPKALENPNDIEARSKMSLADTLGGLTNSNAGVTLPHGLGMQVGGHAPHVSHGQALAIIYPQFTRYTYAWAIEKFAKVGRIFNPALNELSDEEAAKEACVAIDDFLKKIGLWIGFKDVNVTKEQIREIADDGQVLGDYLNNPRVATIDEMYELLMNCYERKE
ncbi:MAG TPA: alcohol dehydrogenase [Hungateiclostridium thermocellum]|jgi:alcohol dehydrogenase class IV|uniref:Iron-containing alcohol dehydrogenase n=2 Tax=Acetivibrio thermocellus TaxID=1515 RepID=A3DCF3_ACET2|nr:iron-containing alcohol dehydrogenase [Acetivibrio thermocellus]CDG35090.1 iron-containing alcohol dehydrogenase [Acetivibrio thermocellus BC1]ABN51632.1 iron-containing alcohol dehydrogenase [Acetivibrio thermocellus ATCC 27405]ADU74883.1 iron-containing alcohol dehydrogenase [Acetivibrio thermocellus DSM 1313]ALX08838.1 Alcohol dehydrogenase [Acetivibrio thermocellus AD2]ANV76588.1 Alcohol dehydrogenase [Acetivibrio thermocellus DSM 2360]